ncbi:hypothetical protein KFK09_015123 [Dendrobium nobile]|uniref:Uncharacterized protein n=1 Tax=Dendrobium nobile TaxID=94219 RepID=A0A8T3B3X1_DENNO|nr:hypothetical protein KFK09_015123 [Dendrobium nobile]
MQNFLINYFISSIVCLDSNFELCRCISQSLAMKRKNEIALMGFNIFGFYMEMVTLASFSP